MKTSGFTDIHQHVLWGLDDGPKTPEQMRALLAQNVQSGISLIFATSHAYPKTRPFELALYRERLDEANAYCESQGWNLRVLSGCEIHYCDSVPDLLTAGRLPALGSSRHVLIEFDHDAALSQIGEAADSLYRAGFQPVLAHVERYRCLMRSPRRAMEVREEYGLIYQMNCETVLRPAGLWERRFAEKLINARAVDAIATDAHDTAQRPVRMREAYQQIARQYGVRYAGRLVRFGRQLAREGIAP